MAELFAQNADLPRGGTDASVIAPAERVDTDTGMTLGCRHFAAVAPRHQGSFVPRP